MQSGEVIIVDISIHEKTASLLYCWEQIFIELSLKLFLFFALLSISLKFIRTNWL